jgi:hypothetical protein
MRRNRSTKGPLLLLGILYMIPAAMAGVMLFFGIRDTQMALIVGGGVGLIFVGSSAPLGFLLVSFGGRFRDTAKLRRTIDEVRENSMLSDNAKRVLFRDRELGLLRCAVEDDIARGDYNAAITLCDEMSALFGQRQEAEAFRSRIAQARAKQYELEVQAALDQLDASLQECDWAMVHQQAARIRRLYPDSHIVRDLEVRIETARSKHKSELEGRFLEAAEQDDPAAAMQLLKQLDHYMSRNEAHRLTDAAQGVILRHRESLGHAFRTAVSKHRWAAAAEQGEAIIAEFPNSQMANEARPLIEVLRSRAAGVVPTETC